MKVALITGGSRGLGKSAALHTAARGVGVVITYNSKVDEANEVVREIKSKGGQAIALQLDTMKISNFADFAGQLEKNIKQAFGASKVDYVVHNAGFGENALIEQTSEEQFDRLMNVHLKGPFFLTQKLMPLLADGGHILNFSSGLARFSFPGYAAYAMMKGGVEVMTRYMAKELGARGIRVNTVAPGPIETDFGGGQVRDNKDFNQQLANMTSLGRVGLPDDIGQLVASLLSDDSKWVNAQRIEASGGLFI